MKKQSKLIQLHIRGRLFFVLLWNVFLFLHFLYYLLLVIIVTERGHLKRQQTLGKKKIIYPKISNK